MVTRMLKKCRTDPPFDFQRLASKSQLFTKTSISQSCDVRSSNILVCEFFGGCFIDIYKNIFVSINQLLKIELSKKLLILGCISSKNLTSSSVCGPTGKASGTPVMSRVGRVHGTLWWPGEPSDCSHIWKRDWWKIDFFHLKTPLWQQNHFCAHLLHCKVAVMSGTANQQLNTCIAGHLWEFALLLGAQHCILGHLAKKSVLATVTVQ